MRLRRKVNPAVGTVLVIGAVSAAILGGIGWAFAQTDKPKPKAKKKVCDTGYELQTVNGVDICVPIKVPSSPKPRPKPPVDFDDEDLILEPDLVLPAPRSPLVSGECPSKIRSIVASYLNGNGNAQGALSLILKACGADGVFWEIEGKRRPAILQYVIDIAQANAGLAGTAELRAAAASAM